MRRNRDEHPFLGIAPVSTSQKRRAVADADAKLRGALPFRLDPRQRRRRRFLAVVDFLGGVLRVCASSDGHCEQRLHREVRSRDACSLVYRAGRAIAWHALNLRPSGDVSWGLTVVRCQTNPLTSRHWLRSIQSLVRRKRNSGGRAMNRVRVWLSALSSTGRRGVTRLRASADGIDPGPRDRCAGRRGAGRGGDVVEPGAGVRHDVGRHRHRRRQSISVPAARHLLGKAGAARIPHGRSRERQVVRRPDGAARLAAAGRDGCGDGHGHRQLAGDRYDDGERPASTSANSCFSRRRAVAISGRWSNPRCPAW